MPAFLISITGLLAGLGVLLIGHGLAGTLLSLRGTAEGYSDALIGLIMAAYFSGYILGTFYGPALINRTGHIRTFAASAALAGALVIVHGLLPDPWLWLIARFIYGACIVVIYLVIESWLNAQSGDLLRGRVFAVYMLVNLLAMAAGQQLLLVGNVEQLELFALAAALFCAGVVPLALTRVTEPKRVKKFSINLRELYRTTPLGLAGCLAAGIAGGAFWALGPLFARQLGLSTDAIATFMSITIIGGALLQWPLGHWSDRLDRRKVLAVISLGAAVFAFISAVIPTTSPWMLWVTMFIYGGLYFAIYPLSVAHSNDRASPEQFVTIGSSLLLVYGIGAILGPLLGGVLMQAMGPSSLPVLYVICWLALGGYALNRCWRQGPPADKEAFSPLVRTSPMAVTASVKPQSDRK